MAWQSWQLLAFCRRGTEGKRGFERRKLGAFERRRLQDVQDADFFEGLCNREVSTVEGASHVLQRLSKALLGSLTRNSAFLHFRADVLLGLRFRLSFIRPSHVRIQSLKI